MFSYGHWCVVLCCKVNNSIKVNCIFKSIVPLYCSLIMLFWKIYLCCAIIFDFFLQMGIGWSLLLSCKTFSWLGKRKWFQYTLIKLELRTRVPGDWRTSIYCLLLCVFFPLKLSTISWKNNVAKARLRVLVRRLLPLMATEHQV